MTSPPRCRRYAEFARYAFPPNELGYCGPADSSVLLAEGSAAELAAHAKEFDGAWPYLGAIADAAGITDPLDAEVVRNYWVGGPLLQAVDPDALLSRLRPRSPARSPACWMRWSPGEALAHHSFHVFAVYPWVRFLDRGPTKPVQVMQDCRVRWGIVESVQGDHAVIDVAAVDVRRRQARARRSRPRAGAVAQGRHLPGAGTRRPGRR